MLVSMDARIDDLFWHDGVETVIAPNAPRQSVPAGIGVVFGSVMFAVTIVSLSDGVEALPRAFGALLMDSSPSVVVAPPPVVAAPAEPTTAPDALIVRDGTLEDVEPDISDVQVALLGIIEVPESVDETPPVSVAPLPSPVIQAATVVTPASVLPRLVPPVRATPVSQPAVEVVVEKVSGCEALFKRGVLTSFEAGLVSMAGNVARLRDCVVKPGTRVGGSEVVEAISPENKTIRTNVRVVSIVD